MSDNSVNSTRRGFLKMAGLSVFVAAPMAASLKALAESGKLVMVAETDPQAAALGYKADASKVDTKKYPKRATPEGKKQFCYNCQFYQFTGTDAKAPKAAPCQLFPGKSVASKGWCNSWVQNPKVTT